MDSEGWVSLERPVKTSYFEETDVDTAEWTAFVKKNGIEKTIISFPSHPIYFYSQNGIVVESSLNESSFHFEVYSERFQKEAELFSWRLEALKSQSILEKNSYTHKDGSHRANFSYFNGEKWVFEHWIGSKYNTYFLRTETPLKNDDFHRQFIASFDLEFDARFST